MRNLYLLYACLMASAIFVMVVVEPTSGGAMLARWSAAIISIMATAVFGAGLVLQFFKKR